MHAQMKTNATSMWARGASRLDEQPTADLLALLRAARTPEDYLAHGVTMNRTVPGYLKELLDARHMKRAEVVRACGLHPTVVYDIFAGKSRPGRDHAIMLAFGLGCTLEETQRLLKLSNNAELWPKVSRDSIIIWCIDNKLSRAECDDELWLLGERTLLGVDPRKQR